MHYILLLPLLLLSCGDPPKPPDSGWNTSSTPNQRIERHLERPADFVQSVNSFGLEFYKTLAKDDTGNIAISPLSIHTSLSIAAAAAAGETRDEILQALHCEIDPEFLLDSLFAIVLAQRQDSVGEYASDFRSVSAVWPNKSIQVESAFKDRIHKSEIDLFALNFDKQEDAARTINDWARIQTRGKIDEIVDADDFNDLMCFVITNAVAAIGKWMIPFSEGGTKPRAFYLENGDSLSAPSMYKSPSSFAYADLEGFSALTMNTADTRLSFHIFLPDSGTSLLAFEEQLSARTFQSWLDSIRVRDAEVAVYLPKFSWRAKYDLKPGLKTLGVRSAFGMRADFSGMLGGGPGRCFISVARHAALVSVEETGFEAYAVTALVALWVSEQSNSITFDVNRPFFFAITHNKTGALLFCGRIVNPMSSQS